MANFAFDIDGTWDADPELFCLFAKALQNNGHSVWIVTGAKELASDKRVALQLQWFPVVCTSGYSKKHHCDAIGIHIDIWIDNDPASITSQFIKPNIDHEL
jgi:hypothetical protein